jgi:surface antigen
MSRSLVVLAVVVLAFVALTQVGTAHASGLGFLRNSAIARFEESDYKLMLAAAEEALASPERGAARTWSNPATRNGGEVHVTSTFTSSSGSTCKELRVVTRAADRSGSSRYTVCRAEDGAWRLASRAVRPR